jgi:hypothetical protein
MADVTLIPYPTQIELVRLSATASEITAVVRAQLSLPPTTEYRRLPAAGARLGG